MAGEAAEFLDVRIGGRSQVVFVLVAPGADRSLGSLEERRGGARPGVGGLAGTRSYLGDGRNMRVSGFFFPEERRVRQAQGE